jgi:hypothetical protein
MASTVSSSSSRRHLDLPEGKRSQAKAHLRSPEIEPDWRGIVGSALQRAIELLGWSSKVAAGKVGIDDGQFGRWLSGSERAQLDRLWKVEELRQPLVIAMAERAGLGVRVRTVVTLKQRLGGHRS